MKILGPTWEDTGQPGKNERGRGISRELLSFSQYAPRRVRDEREALLQGRVRRGVECCWIFSAVS